jgi:hypothetical protein
MTQDVQTSTQPQRRRELDVMGMLVTMPTFSSKTSRRTWSG